MSVFATEEDAVTGEVAMSDVLPLCLYERAERLSE